MSVDGDYERRIELRQNVVQEEIRGREARLQQLTTSLRSEERRAMAQQQSFEQVLSSLRLGAASKSPVSRLEYSRQLVEKLRDRKASLKLVHASIEQLAKEHHGVVSELSSDEQRVRKMGEMRELLIRGREQQRADQDQEELSEVISVARESIGEDEIVAVGDAGDVLNHLGAVESQPILLGDAPTAGYSQGPGLDLSPDGGRHQQPSSDPQQMSGGAQLEAPAPPPSTAADFEGQVRAFEQWQQLGSEGVRVNFCSSSGGAYEVSVVAREGSDLDIAIMPARGVDARTLRRARQEIEQQLQQAGLSVRRLEVR